MKKIIVFVLLIAAICSTAFVKFEKNPLFDVGQVEKVCFVNSRPISGEGIDAVYCGDMVFNYCSLETAQKNLKNLKNDAKGIEFYIKNVKIDDILTKLDAEVISNQTIDQLCVICAYTPYYQDCIYINGKKANLQIAHINNQIIVGFPTIFTGF